MSWGWFLWSTLTPLEEGAISTECYQVSQAMYVLHLEPNVTVTLMAKSQCSLAVVSCSICLSTSATDKLQLLFFLPQTTFSRPVSTLWSSEFKSLQLSKRKQNKTKQILQQLVTQWKKPLIQEVPAAEQLGLTPFKECPCNLLLFPHQLIGLNTITTSTEITNYLPSDK